MPPPTPTPIPTQERVTPPCPHFGPCGGCQLQDLTYSAQLALKAEQLGTSLESAGLTLPDLQIHTSPPFEYRNRIRLTLAEVDGQLRAGYLSRRNDSKSRSASAVSDEGDDPESPSGSFSFLPITQCPIAASILWRTAEAFLKLINGEPNLWMRNPQFKFDQLELFTTADESALQFTIYLRTASKTLPNKLATAFAALCEDLRCHIPELNGAGISLLPALSARSRRAEQPRPGPSWGSPGLNYAIPTTNNQQLTTSYWIPRGAFFQVNRFLPPELLELATANRTGALAWDLYAGVGLFSRVLAASFAHVTAVEIAEPAVTALASTKLANLRAVKSTTLDFLHSSVIERDRPGLIVIDPPRTGAGVEVCGLLARIAAPTVVFVSCSPETLPTDLAILTASGYRVTELHLFDLFPQTSHIETVAILTR